MDVVVLANWERTRRNIESPATTTSLMVATYLPSINLLLTMLGTVLATLAALSRGRRVE